MTTAAQPVRDDALDLHGYLTAIGQRWRTVAATTAAAVGVALVVSIVQTPIYQAEVEVLLEPSTLPYLLPPEVSGPGRTSAGSVSTEIGLMGSRSVRDAVAEALGRPAEVEVEAQGDTDLVTVRAESGESVQAAETANTYVEVYIEHRRQRQVEDLQVAIDQVGGTVAELDARLDQLEQPLVELDAQIAAASPTVAEALEIQRAELVVQIAGQRDEIERQRAPYVAQLGQLRLATDLIEADGPRIVSPAVVPMDPVRAQPVRASALALIIGGLLGLTLALVRDHLDDTVKTKDDLQHATGELTVLGLVPAVASWRNRERSFSASLVEPASAAAEAYRSLRTAVQFIGLDRHMKVIQLTSANPEEGKTTTLANLAVALARTGQRVTILCCDLRRPRVHEFLDCASEPGFTSILLGETPLASALQEVPDQGQLTLVAAGPEPPNPTELLASSRTEEVVGLLRTNSDVLLIDCPPVLPVSDALIISRHVDATILVATAGRTRRKEVQRAVELLRQVDAPLVGAVLNEVESGGTYRYEPSYRRDNGTVPASGGTVHRNRKRRQRSVLQRLAGSR